MGITVQFVFSFIQFKLKSSMKNLFIGTSPNIQKDDIKLIFASLFRPWAWREEEAVYKFEEEIANYVSADSNSFAIAFDSARTSFFKLLEAWDIGKGDEVLVPSFTCVVIVNSVLQAGATPVYIDTDPDTFNISLDDLRAKISNKTKAVLVQHTFGVFIDVQKIRELVGDDIKIVEDHAHSLQRDVWDDKTSDALVLTFGIEKTMTSLRGGMAVVRDEALYKSLKDKQRNLKEFSYRRIFVWLINPLLWAIITPLYFVGLGKFTIGRLFSQAGHKLGLMGNMVEGCEYRGCFPNWMPAKMPGVLAEIGLNQLRKLDKFNEHRRIIGQIYDEAFGNTYSKTAKYTPLRYPLLVDEPIRVLAKLRKHHVIAGNWYNRILFTDPKYLAVLGFDPKSCPITIEITPKVINLPTFIKVTEEDAKKIVEIIKKFD